MWDPARVTRIGGAVFGAYLIAFAFFFWWSPRFGETDFRIFYTVGLHLADKGAIGVHDPAALLPYELKLGDQLDGALLTGISRWHYPPPFLFVASLLPTLPYSWAFVIWTVAGLTVLLAGVRALVPWWSLPAMALALAMPSTLVNMGYGQNGFVTAGLFGLSLAMLPARPLTAGACMGLLVFKPHFGLLLPVALLAGGHWRAFAAAGLSAALVTAASAAAFGVEAWSHFFTEGVSLARATLAGTSPVLPKMVTVQAMARLLGASDGVAEALQAVTILAAAAVVAVVWRSATVGHADKIVVLALATVLTLPFAFAYDLVLLTIPVTLWLAQRAKDRQAIGRAESAGLWVMAMLPALSHPIALTTGLVVTPLVIAGALGVTVARIRRRGWE